MNHEISHEKKWTHKISTGKKLEPTKHPREKGLDPQITEEKIFRPMKYPREKCWIHEDGTMALDQRDLRNLTHSGIEYLTIDILLQKPFINEFKEKETF